MWFGNTKNNERLQSGLRLLPALLLVGVAAWVLNALTPESGDDFWYRFPFVGREVDLTHPVSSFRELLRSQQMHYLWINGRFPVHLLVQSFAATGWGRILFKFFNAAIFTLFAGLLVRFSGMRCTASGILFAAAAVLLLWPAFGETMLWMTGSINYLWSSVLVCLFLLGFERLRERPFRVGALLGFLPALLAGWTHEGLTVPLAVSLLVELILRWRTLGRSAALPLVAGLVAGACLCLFSPGTSGRVMLADDTGIWLFVRKGMSFLSVVSRLRALPLLLCCLAAGCWLRKEGRLRWLREQYADNRLLCHVVLLSLGVVFGSGYIEIRSAFGVEFSSLLILLRLAAKLPRPVLKRVKTAVCLVAGGGYAAILAGSVANYRETRQLLAQLEHSRSDIILYEERSYPAVLDSYIVRMHRALCSDSDWNRYMAAVYGRARVSFLPAALYREMAARSEKTESLSRQSAWPYYVVPVAADLPEGVRPHLVLRPADYSRVPFWMRSVAPRLERYRATEVRVNRLMYEVVEVDGRLYAVVGRHPFIDDRVTNIVMK